MKILREETQYHHGSFKDLQTFLDKNGDPYTLIKSDYPENKLKDNNGKNNSHNQSNQNNSNSNNQSSNQNQQNNQQSNQSNNQQNQNNNQNQRQNNNNQQQKNQNSQRQNQQKVLPDPNASYVDVNTGFEYKWDPQKNQFIRVGKYRAK